MHKNIVKHCSPGKKKEETCVLLIKSKFFSEKVLDFLDAETKNNVCAQNL